MQGMCDGVHTINKIFLEVFTEPLPSSEQRRFSHSFAALEAAISDPAGGFLRLPDLERRLPDLAWRLSGLSRRGSRAVDRLPDLDCRFAGIACRLTVHARRLPDLAR